MTAPDVIIVNTLGGALRHYTAALAASLRPSGDRISIKAIDEPSAADGSAVGWLLRYIRTLLNLRRAAHRQGTQVIVTWPVLGHFDRLIMRAILGRRISAALILHDPRPLVHARGYSRLARRTARFGRRVRIIVHSTTAQAALQQDCPDITPDLLPHPVLCRTTPHPSDPDPHARPVIRVLGQYKPDRDLGLLAKIAEHLYATHRLEIVGRSWPRVPGWIVADTFVPEAELDRLMLTADAVLVPYSRFFQSGIAIRALELGTPAIGPANSSIADLYPDDRYLADTTADSWCAAITAAVAADRDHTAALAERASETCRIKWAHWRTRTAHTAQPAVHRTTRRHPHKRSPHPKR